MADSLNDRRTPKEARVKLTQNKKMRRRWLTWLRMSRYGVNNFTRNAWLTTAATAVMTITLLIIFTTFMTKSIISSTVDQIRQKVDYSIYLKTDVTEAEAQSAKDALSTSKNVSSVRYINTDEARQDYIAKNHPSPQQLQIISELPPELNPFIPSFQVVIKDPSQTKQLADVVANDPAIHNALNTDPKRAPSFTGDKRKIIDNISRWTTIAERGGIIASAIFIAISMLIIFNTIRMAIFNRRDEIDMMKLIGADKSFIRGPFVVEAVMYGFFAAIFATILGFAIMFSIEPKLADWQIPVAETHDTLVTFSPLILVIMILLGALIGNISSRLAVRRYLKV